jgi:hypothetical protein
MGFGKRRRKTREILYKLREARRQREEIKRKQKEEGLSHPGTYMFEI